MGETKNIELTGIVQTFFSCIFFLVLSKFDANYPCVTYSIDYGYSICVCVLGWVIFGLFFSINFRKRILAENVIKKYQQKFGLIW